MTENEQFLNKILDIYGKHFYPSVKMKVTEVKEADGRIYLTHGENSSIISLLPPITNDNIIRK